jgi:hypothetical protein
MAMVSPLSDCGIQVSIVRLRFTGCQARRTFVDALSMTRGSPIGCVMQVKPPGGVHEDATESMGRRGADRALNLERTVQHPPSRRASGPTL